MNTELVKQALEKVTNPNILVNFVSRRVRQMNAGGGGLGRPLVKDVTGWGFADIALKEIVDGVIDYELLEPFEGGETETKKRKRKKS